LAGYLEKAGIFFGSAAVAVTIYKLVLEKREFWLFKKLDGFNISFQKICVSIGVFFAGVIAYFGWVVA
jgi:hypothetical protein